MNLGSIKDYIENIEPHMSPIKITESEIITDKLWDYHSTNQELFNFFISLAKHPSIGVSNFSIEILRSLTNRDFSYSLYTECNDPFLEEAVIRIFSCKSNVTESWLFKQKAFKYQPGIIQPVTRKEDFKLEEPFVGSEFLGCFVDCVIASGCINSR